MFGEAGDKWVATECLEGLALIARAQGRPERAARLFGAAEAARETFGITMQRPVAGDQEGFWTAIRERPAETAFAVAWAEGRAMTLEQAIEYGLTSAELGTLTGQQPCVRRPDGDLLTAREREVARLVAGGLTNREIAATLVVSRRTADAHVQNILNKLGFNSRAQVAAWAVERGLRGEREADSAPPDARSSQPRRAT